MDGRTCRHGVRTLLALTAFLAGGAVLSTRVVALDGNNTIRACYQRENGLLRILGDGRQCRHNEVAISWNTQGPEGPAGPPGLKGDSGAPGISALERVDFSTTNNSDAQKHVFARCPTGKHVVGCGAQVFMGESRTLMGPIAVKKVFPSDAMDGCAATAEAMAPTELRWFLTTYALCAMVETPMSVD